MHILQRTVILSLFQTTTKKNGNGRNPNKHVDKSKTTVAGKIKPQNTNDQKKAPTKPPKSVSFKMKSCRRSLCFSDGESDDQGAVSFGRKKRETAMVETGFYKEKPINAKLT